NESKASGGSVVGHIDYSDSYVKFNNVEVPRSGIYKVTVRYDNGLGDCTDKVKVNNGDEFALSLPNSGGWNKFQTATFQTRLENGLNSIKLSHSANYAQIDSIHVEPVGSSNE
ncbi:MAG TPA: carbohydrate-binding protein, partial [Bacillales bacterium]|nr:carbohydrate-binding protein [Bacillales bacterium]